jgi:hypothetical protein
MSSGESERGLCEGEPNGLFRIEELPQCLSHKISLNYFFEQLISRPFMEGLRGLGPMEVRDDLPRTLFKINRPYVFSLAGVVGTREIRVDYDDKAIAEAKPLIEAQFVAAAQALDKEIREEP